MDREILNIFLQSGPARKLDISRCSRIIAKSDKSNKEYLFRNSFLNHTLLFKCIMPDEYDNHAGEKPISTLVYMPYDLDNPQEGGESFIFSPTSFFKYCGQKYTEKNIDLTAIEYDIELLKVFDSLPTFSPLIVELAFERSNMTIPSAYLGFTPELRAKLRAQLKGRIRPLIAAAYDGSSVSVEKAVEEMTANLFSLHDVREILPLVQALKLPPENAVEFLASWIGITYFEYEYSKIQEHLKEFALWLAKYMFSKENINPRDRDYIDSLVLHIKVRLSVDWKRISALSNEYRDTYRDLVYNGSITSFSNFLMKCKSAYWELGDLLGRFEQTAIAWRIFKASYVGRNIPVPVLVNFFVLLRKLHDEPPHVHLPQTDMRGSIESAGFPHFAPDLF